MKAGAWRSVLLALCAVTVLIRAADICGMTGIGRAPPWYGLWGNTLVAASRPYNLAVLSVDPSGPSDIGGLRQGDLVDIRANNLTERFSVIGQPLNGRPISLLVHRGSIQKRLTIVPRGVKFERRWDTLIFEFIMLWIVAFAALIAWRRSDVREMRLLCLVLVCYTVMTGTYYSFFAAPWTWVYVLFFSLNALASLCIALWAAFAGCFAQPLSHARSVVGLLCYALAAIAVIMQFAAEFGLITLQYDPTHFFFSWQSSIPFDGAMLAALIASVLAIAAAGGEERRRAAWSLAPLAVLFVSITGSSMLDLATSSYATYIAVSYATNVALVLAPVVLTYAALSRRLIDIGFVLNRTVVFAVISAIGVGAFILVEWIASEWLAGLGARANVLAGMVAALALGLSLRYIHTYVDRFVDRVFFRKRHEDEAALRRFAHESSYITDRNVLLERTVQEVKEHTNAEQATILVPDGNGAYVSAAQTDRFHAPVDENDPAIVALRAWHKPLDLDRSAASAVRGHVLFPMVARGELVGVLVCGTKHGGEKYAPDESDALELLAHGVGSSLGNLALESPTEFKSLAETQALILQELRTLSMRSSGQTLADFLARGSARPID